jgi:hypothetical protein
MRTLIFPLLTAASALAQQCPGFPNCLYTPAQTYQFARQTLRLEYTDVTGRPRRLEVTARIPNRTGPLPVIIWAHGGEGRPFNASEGALDAWANIGAQSGYLSLTPAFWVREGEDRLALCKYLGLREGEPCEQFSTASFDRPYDIRAIIDELEQQNRSGPLRGRIDVAKLAVAGHSAGSGGTLSVAGATREIDGKRYGPEHFADPRPKAFIALSPSAPGASFMFDTSLNDNTTSWTTVDRPVLMITGLGDENEQYGRGRSVVFDYLPPRDKFRLWVNDADFGHGDYGDDLDSCPGTPERKCEAFRNVLVSAVRAYLDAYLENNPRAKTFLEEGHAAGAARDTLEWSRK